MRTRHVATGFLVVAATLVHVSPAHAGHGGAANSGIPDNIGHYIDRNSITAISEVSVAQGIAQLNRSVMNATLTGSGDVEVWDGYYGTTGEWLNRPAVTDCPTPAATAGVCDVYRIRINLSYTVAYYDAVLKSVGCHEFGHTAGLGHRPASGDTDNNSCMQAAFSASRTSYDAHDISAINNTF